MADAVGCRASWGFHSQVHRSPKMVVAGWTLLIGYLAVMKYLSRRVLAILSVAAVAIRTCFDLNYSEFGEIAKVGNVEQTHNPFSSAAFLGLLFSRMAP